MSHDLLVQMAYSCAILPHFVSMKYLKVGKTEDIYLVAF